MNKENLVLRGITWDHIRGYGPLNASIVPYQKENGIQIQWDKRNLKDFGDASLDKLAREYDLIIMDHPHVGIACETRCILPLDEILEVQAIAEAWLNSVGPSFSSYRYDDHLWALPIDAACQVSCRRNDLLGEFSLPDNWNDVFLLATALKTKKLFIGMALCPTDCNCSFLTLCAQLGDPVQENKFTSTTTGLNAISILKKLFMISHPESRTWNPIRLYDYMASEDDVAYCPLAFGYTNYSREGYCKNKLHYGKIPGKSFAVLGGAGIAVSAHCRAVDEAAAYSVWLCGENFQSQMYLEAGGQPAHKKAWINSNADAITGQFFTNTITTMEAAFVRPRNSIWPLFQEDLGEIIHSGLIKNFSGERIWDEVQASYKHFFKESAAS